MSTVAAADVYEVVLEEASGPKSWFRTVLVFVFGLFTMGSGMTNPGGMVISVVHKETGDELFRHIEDLGDDEGHLLDGIENDLASMTAQEFAARWG